MMIRSVAMIGAVALMVGCGSAVRSGAAVSAPAAPGAEVSQKLLATPQGHTVELEGVPLKDAKDFPWRKIVMPGPALVFSDDPEYVRVPEGIATQEVVDSGRVRLYVYNVNGMENYQMRISAVIENLGDEPMTLTMYNAAFPQPSGNYFHIGKTGLIDFFGGNDGIAPRTIAPGEIVAIDERMENTLTSYNDLVHGFYEFLIDQPARISVVASGAEMSGPEAVQRVPILPVNEINAGRGLFGTSNYLVIPAEQGDVLDSATGIQQIIVADNDRDPWALGFEGTAQVPMELRGNYGIMYDLEIPYTTSDGRGLAMVMYNYRFGSAWCNAMAAGVKVGDGVHDAGVVAIPSNKLNTPHEPEVVLVQVFPPVPDGETGTIKMTYSPPGASCLPIPIVLIPVDM